MATFYTGYRPVLKGRNKNNMVHAYKGTVGVYSHWHLYSSDHVLDGFPDENVQPGAGDYPHGLLLSRMFRGLKALYPLDNSGGGNRLAYARFRPLEFKGTTAQRAFGSGFGHVDRETEYAIQSLIFDGVQSAKVFSNFGHARDRADGPANISGHNPNEHRGVDLAMDDGFGQTVPAGFDNAYGRNRVNEYRGVTSAKALNIT